MHDTVAATAPRPVFYGAVFYGAVFYSAVFYGAVFYGTVFYGLFDAAFFMHQSSL